RAGTRREGEPATNESDRVGDQLSRNPPARTSLGRAGTRREGEPATNESDRVGDQLSRNPPARTSRVRVRFGRDFGELEISEGTSLLAAAARASAPLGNACRGQGVCRACAVLVVSGAEQLDPPGELERAMGLEPGWRMACQTRVRGVGQLSLWTFHWGGSPRA
ncbi:MAG: 2Fe-2S iron-sulfur cluster-binding protein, partial [Enhygromyxa sp.]